ncbi:MAG: FHA domain-containing protein [Gammaproteobacteria bacterium]
MDIACVQEPLERLQCDYRLRDGGKLEAAVAEYQGTIIEGREVRPYPQPDDRTAILVLVDTSDPARQPVIDKVREHIEALLASGAPHRQLGLAAFDTDLHVLAAVGTPPDELRKAAAMLSAEGRTTELYRNVREAVRLLGEVEATRRVLLLMSDGLAEDFAYHHEDVVAAARAAGVIIDSIGYPRSVTRSVALQTVRRLSDETGGLYVQADLVDFDIPRETFARLLDAADSGGRLEFDLGALLRAGATGALDVSLSFETTAQNFLVLAPVVFPGVTTPPTAPAPVISAPALPSSPLPQPLPGGTPPPAWPWFAILALLLAAILAALTFLVQRQRRAASVVGEPTKPLAYLVLADQARTRHAIDKLPWRIGRGRNNDLVLPDHSVSRLHADIRASEDGHLLLNDLESLNGVFVNDNRIDSIQMREGDAIDIGDVRMVFTLKDESYANQESTVLVRTRTPL